MHYIIGVGGGGSHLVWPLAKIKGNTSIALVDGDTLERKNLDRQKFDEADLGFNKAQAMAAKFPGMLFIPEYYHAGSFWLNRSDVLWCCADNHACRKQVLEACDMYRCRAVIGANEYTDAEAYWYEPSWKDTPNDPRVVYPVILTDDTNDPLRPEGCVEASQRHPQLVLANMLSADMMLWLWHFHTKERPKLELTAETAKFLPCHHTATMWKLGTIRAGDERT